MNSFLKKAVSAVITFCLAIQAVAFASEILPEEKTAIRILCTRGGTELSADVTETVLNNMNRYSPLAMYYDTSSGIPAYYLHTNSSASLEVEPLTETMLHRIMADKNYESFEPNFENFENSVLRLRVAAGNNFSKILPDDSGRKNIKIGLSYTKKEGIYPTDVKYVQLADYVDTDAMASNKNTYYDVEIPVREILESEDFVNLNGSVSTMLQPEDINGVTITMDVGGGKTSVKVMYFTDMYLAYCPDAPQDLNAETTSDTASLAWEYDGDDVSFNVFRNGNYIATVDDKTYTDSSLKPETKYSYQIQTVKGETASKAVEINVSTKAYFSDPSLLEAGFKDIEVNGNGTLSDAAIVSGTNTVTGKLFSDSFSSGAVVVGAAYKGNVMKAADIDILSSVSADGEEFSLTVNADDIDCLKFFAVDSLENLKLISQVGAVSSDGFDEIRIGKAESSVLSVSPEFDSSDSGFILGAEQPFVLLAASKNTDLSDIDEENAGNLIAYADVFNMEETENKIKILFNDSLFADGYYSFYSSLAGYGISGNAESGYYASSETVKNIYSDLNSDDVDNAGIRECIENPVLNLDLTDYKRVSSDDVITLFAEIKGTFADVLDIEKTLDEAVGTVLFCTKTEVSLKDAEKYGNIIGLDSDILSKLLADDKDSFVNEYTFSLLSEKEDEISAENARELFKEAYICALASDDDNTWKMLQTVVYTYCDVDKSLITSDIDESAVFKNMLGQAYETAEEIEAAYAASVKKQKSSSSTSSKSSGSRTGGGGTSFTTAVNTQIDNTDVNAEPVGDTVVYGIFGDLPLSHWAYDSVSRLVDENIISRDVNFRPDDNVKREEFVKMMVMIFKPVTVSRADFDDVSETDWFSPYVNAAYSAGIVSGISDTLFGAGSDISRQDMAIMLYRAIKASKAVLIEAETAEDGNQELNQKFADASDISDYAEEAIQFLCDNGIMNGDTSGNVRPLSSASRAECAKLICNFLNQMKNIKQGE